MLRKYLPGALFVFFTAVSLGANAATFTYTGSVTNATGAFAALTPTGTFVGGPIVIDDAAVTAGLAGVADFISGNVNVGGFCVTTDTPSSCPNGGSNVPITSIDALNMTFVGGGSTGGLLDVTVFSPTFMVDIFVSFDFNAGTFIASAAGLGTASGAGILSPMAPIPVPAAFWLLGSAMLGAFGFRRRA